MLTGQPEPNLIFVSQHEPNPFIKRAVLVNPKPVVFLPGSGHFNSCRPYSCCILAVFTFDWYLLSYVCLYLFINVQLY